MYLKLSLRSALRDRRDYQLYTLTLTVLTGVMTLAQMAAALGDREVLFAIAYLGVMATTVALLFQNVGQLHSDTASASVILSLESVFGVICSVIFYHDRVTPPMLLGFVLIFAAVLCGETKFSFLQKKPRTAPPVNT